MDTDETPIFDPLDSPLSPGGRARPTGKTPDFLPGLLDFPATPHPRRVIYRVRREGWVARRAAARSRYHDLDAQGPSSVSRILGKLVSRRGVLDEAREKARPRFNLRGRP